MTLKDSSYVESVKVIGAKTGVTLGTLSLSGFIARPQTLETEHVETFGQHRIFLVHFTRRARQLLLENII